jgi:molybdopterin synthase catalytic subunit
MMFRIVREPIDVASVEGSVRGDGYGGVVVFAGVVRATSDDGKPVLGLEYEAHETMAIEELERIAAELAQRHGDLRIAMVHREGPLNVGEVAVVVAVAAPHRAAAFAACAEAIDALKRRAPIWKKERYCDGSDRWRENAP